MLDSALRHSFWMMIVCSSVPLGISACCGLIVSIFQAATQIQEPTIIYAIKFGAVCVVIFFGGEIFATELMRFIQELISSIELIGKV